MEQGDQPTDDLVWPAFGGGSGDGAEDQADWQREEEGPGHHAERNRGAHQSTVPL